MRNREKKVRKSQKVFRNKKTKDQTKISEKKIVRKRFNRNKKKLRCNKIKSRF